MNRKAQIALLELHQSRLQECVTFEAYQAAHVAYVGMLIAAFKAEEVRDKAIVEYVKVEPQP